MILIRSYYWVKAKNSAVKEFASVASYKLQVFHGFVPNRQNVQNSWRFLLLQVRS